METASRKREDKLVLTETEMRLAGASWGREVVLDQSSWRSCLGPVALVLGVSKRGSGGKETPRGRKNVLSSVYCQIRSNFGRQKFDTWRFSRL